MRPQVNKSSGVRTRLLDFNPLAMSLFRVALAAYILVYRGIALIPIYPLIYTDKGVLPHEMAHSFYTMPGQFSLLTLSDAPAFHLCFLFVHIIAAALLLIGCRTRLATCMLLITCISLNGRNPIALGSHTMLLLDLLLLWSCFLPLNRYFSVDAALDPAARDRPYPAIALLTMKLQISYVYFFSALFKLAGATWLNGTALAHILEDNIAGGFPIDNWLIAHAPGLIYVGSFAVIGFQFLFVFLVYSPFYNNVTRFVAIAGAVALHLSILLLMDVGSFPQLCFCYLFLLVPDGWWARLFAPRRRRLAAVRIYYDPTCVFCRKISLLFREFCLPSHTPVLPADEDADVLALLRRQDSWVVYDEKGAIRLKWDAVSYILRQSPVLFPLGLLTGLPFLRPVMERLYDLIGRSRNKLARVTEFLLPEKTQPSCGIYMQTLCALLGILALGSNLLQIPCPGFMNCVPTAESLKPHPWKTQWLEVASLLQVKQQWDVFAPNPSHLYIKASLKAHYPQGREVTYLQEGSHLANIAGNAPLSIPIPRMHYIQRLLNERYKEGKREFAFYLCRQLNEAVPQAGQAISLDLTLSMSEAGPKTADKAQQGYSPVTLNYPCPAR